MKTLFIMRHAKSSWDDTNLSDFERPLNKRGLEAASFMGETIRINQFLIDLIVSSPAGRAKQTATLVNEAAQLGGKIVYDDRIYEASPYRLLEIISELNEETKSAMLVGHNPGIENLIKILTGKIEPMPTAALAVIDFEINKWKEMQTESGKLRMLLRPKEVN